MTDLRADLAARLAPPVCVVGVGALEGRGDDAFGPRLAGALAAAGVPNVLLAGTAPERFVGRIATGGFRSVLLLDAVACDAAPGTAVLLDAAEIETRFPQVSTHRFSLGTVGHLLEAHSGTRVHLLGVRPGTLAGDSLSPPVSETLEALREILTDLLSPARAGAGAAA